jgi:peptidoglycan biosynthesis protein MviN/MurJ (putative lipid II flippase)
LNRLSCESVTSRTSVTQGVCLQKLLKLPWSRNIKFASNMKLSVRRATFVRFLELTFDCHISVLMVKYEIHVSTIFDFSDEAARSSHIISLPYGSVGRTTELQKYVDSSCPFR